ncbi:MAG: hypothetical protein NVS1B10_08080 [Candidatus Saccharimonadales bacterium]
MEDTEDFEGEPHPLSEYSEEEAEEIQQAMEIRRSDEADWNYDRI